MNLLFTINKGFMEHLDDCVRSIIRFPSEGGYDIYVIHSDLDLNDQKQLERYDKDIEGNSVTFHFIDMKYRKDMNFPLSDGDILQNICICIITGDIGSDPVP